MLDPSSFAYDQHAPLQIKVLSEYRQNDTIVRDITYASPYGGKVPAYLILPTQQPPQAGLIFGHWGEGNREEFVDEAIVLAQVGFVSLCLDAPNRRPAAYEPQRTQPQTELQWITDVRRGVDLLQATFSLSPRRLGYVGHSYSATFGGIIAGIEHRISAFILMAGWYALSELARTSNVPALAAARSKTPPEIFAFYMDRIASLDAHHYIGQATPSHLFFQFALHDPNVTVADGQQYFNLASEPKQIAWYDNCGHEFNAQARLDRALWLCETLHLPQPSRAILNLLTQLPPPTPLS